MSQLSRIPNVPAILLALCALLAFVPTITEAQPGPSGSGSGGPGGVDDGGDETRGVRWSRVDLEGSKLFLTARTELSLEPVGADMLRQELATSPRGDAVMPEAGGSAWRLAIETSALGRRTSESILFDGQSLAGLQRFKLRHGSKTYSKTYRYADSGVFQLRAEPVDVDEATGPRSGWSKRSETWYDHPAAEDCSVNLDASALLYLAASRRWQEKGETHDFCVFSSKTYSRVRLVHEGTEEVKVGHRLDGEPRQEVVRASRLVLTPEPLLEDDDEPFEMLGLQGEIELLVDPELGLPLEIRGTLSPGGDVTVRLRSAELRP